MKFLLIIWFDFNLVEWLKDNKPIEEGPNCQMTQDKSKKFTMTLPKVRLIDVGQYTVKVTDKNGNSMSATFSVNLTAD